MKRFGSAATEMEQVSATPEDRRRFERIYDEHVSAVLAWSLRRCDRETAQDVVADTFLVAWRKIGSVPDEARPWLLTVARNHLQNARRSDLRRSETLTRLASTLPPAPSLGSPDDLPAEIAAAIGALSPRDRELILLIAWDDLTIVQAARVVGCTPVAARLRLHRARRHLARQLATSGHRPEPSAS